MQHVAPPALPDPRNVRQVVDEPRGDQQPPGADPAAVLEHHGEAAVDRLGRGDASIEHLRSVATDLLPPGLEQRGRGHAVPGEEPVDPGGWRVARLAASMTNTERRDLPRISAPPRPATPPP